MKSDKKGIEHKSQRCMYKVDILQKPPCSPPERQDMAKFKYKVDETGMER